MKKDHNQIQSSTHEYLKEWSGLESEKFGSLINAVDGAGSGEYLGSEIQRVVRDVKTEFDELHEEVIEEIKFNNKPHSGSFWVWRRETVFGCLPGRIRIPCDEE